MKLINNFFSILIRLYQLFISPLSPSCCRFVPTCSQYAHEAIQKHGLLIGGWLALGRILRCNPLFQGGIDPVPKNIRFISKKIK